MEIKHTFEGIAFTDGYGTVLFNNEKEVMSALRKGYCKRNIENEDDTLDAMRYLYNDILTTQKYCETFKSPHLYRYAIQKVIFNEPATIILWADGSKTVVKCAEDEVFDSEKGLAMAICKKILGNDFKKVFKEHIQEVPEEEFKCQNFIDAIKKLNDITNLKIR